MPRKRTLTIDDLRSMCSNPEIEILRRLDDSEMCEMRHISCGHVTEIRVANVSKSVKAICKTCHEDELVIACDACNMIYLTKLVYGTAKSRFEYRLASCKTCGNFIFFTPQHIRSGQIECKLCPRQNIESRCSEVGYVLLNRVTKDLVAGKCKNCNCVNTFQTSNLMRSRPRCCGCNKKVDITSYVYLFKINYDNNVYLKLGKSNVPYLRHLRFTEKHDEVKFDFVKQVQFGNESQAFIFEKQLKEKYKSSNIDSNFAKSFMSTGFTEVYDIGVMHLILKDFETKETTVDN